jgi:ATP-dependent helicase/nuclease subunit A
MIDCWYQMDGRITLIDYKTDRIAGDDQACEQELRCRYGRQLAYYAQAIEAATGKPVARRLVWHIRRARAFLFD